jgi:hypothetical protein
MRDPSRVGMRMAWVLSTKRVVHGTGLGAESFLDVEVRVIMSLGEANVLSVQYVLTLNCIG